MAVAEPSTASPIFLLLSWVITALMVSPSPSKNGVSLPRCSTYFIYRPYVIFIANELGANDR